jgi:hypothetical protein
MIDALSIVIALLVVGFAVFVFFCVSFAFLLFWSISAHALGYDHDIEENDFESRNN